MYPCRKCLELDFFPAVFHVSVSCSLFWVVLSLFPLAVPQNNSTYSHSFNITFSSLTISLWLLSLIKMSHPLPFLPNFLLSSFVRTPVSRFLLCSHVPLDFLCSVCTSYTKYVKRYIIHSSWFTFTLRLFLFAGYLQRERANQSEQGKIYSTAPLCVTHSFFCWLYFWVGFLCSTSPPRSGFVSLDVHGFPPPAMSAS